MPCYIHQGSESLSPVPVLSSPTLSQEGPPAGQGQKGGGTWVGEVDSVLGNRQHAPPTWPIGRPAPRADSILSGDTAKQLVLATRVLHGWPLHISITHTHTHTHRNIRQQAYSKSMWNQPSQQLLAPIILFIEFEYIHMFYKRPNSRMYRPQ